MWLLRNQRIYVSLEKGLHISHRRSKIQMVESPFRSMSSFGITKEKVNLDFETIMQLVFFVIAMYALYISFTKDNS